MQKAVGWMLREVGKHASMQSNGFLEKHAATMPRTALRYSARRHPALQKAFYEVEGWY